MRANNLTLADIDLFVFDFDGVLTNNLVYLDQNGVESVCCSRADGLAFDVLRKLNKAVYILSTEKNSVVSSRANKLDVSVIQGVQDKEESLKSLANSLECELSKIIYIGNDVNDYNSMLICGFSACPSDSHPKIKDIANFVLSSAGGEGVIRELLEEVLCLDFIKILYKK